MSDSTIQRDLRKSIRHQRKSLSRLFKQNAAKKITQQIVHSRFFSPKHLAFYVANDGEVDPKCLIQNAWLRNKACYLPYLAPLGNKHLWYLSHHPQNHLKNNRYGIPEPIFNPAKKRIPWSLSTVFVPLVAFDEFGGRLGMGGGYYDRTFAFLLEARKHRHCPKLVGIAYELQKVNKLALNPWDIPLDAIVTEKQIYAVTT